MKFKTLHYKICGLDYVYIKAPVIKADDGEEYIDLPMGVIEKAIASKLIEDRVPMRGLEIRFIRKSLGLTLKDWAYALGLSAAGVLKWEKAKSTRLTKVNEAAVCSFTAENLKIKIPSVWSKLVAKKDTPKRLSLKIARVA